MPVEIGKIERELKKLWEQGGEMMTRASLINLAVYSEAPDALSANTQIVSQITEDHACRAIVIAANPAAPADNVEAWISAHCHVSRAGKKQVCSEQISFSLGGSFARLLPNIVFSHLDSDLPFYLWWQGEFHDPMDPQLWSWVDRLIYDSQGWEDFNEQMRLVETAQAEANQRVVLCDLNWTRLVQMRLALAQFFDDAASQEKLGAIERVEVDFGDGYRSTAMLLVAWFAAQLGWMPAVANKDGALRFSDCSGKDVDIALAQNGSEPLNRCSIFCGGTEFRVTRASGAALLDASIQMDGQARMHQLMPASRNDPVSLMAEELMRGGPHRVYLRAMQIAREVL